MPTEVEHLRHELRDTRYLVEAVLMYLVGKDKTSLYQMEARVQASVRRERNGTPLRMVGIHGQTHDWLTSQNWRGQDIQTVEELVRRWPRHEAAKLDGIGRKTLEKIEAVIAGRGLLENAWAEEEVA
jgi:hypothetical protein